MSGVTDNINKSFREFFLDNQKMWKVEKKLGKQLYWEEGPAFSS